MGALMTSTHDYRHLRVEKSDIYITIIKPLPRSSSRIDKETLNLLLVEAASSFPTDFAFMI